MGNFIQLVTTAITTEPVNNERFFDLVEILRRSVTAFNQSQPYKQVCSNIVAYFTLFYYIFFVINLYELVFP